MGFVGMRYCFGFNFYFKGDGEIWGTIENNLHFFLLNYQKYGVKKLF